MIRRALVTLSLLATTTGCVTKSAYDGTMNRAIAAEANAAALRDRVEMLSKGPSGELAEQLDAVRTSCAQDKERDRSKHAEEKESLTRTVALLIKMQTLNQRAGAYLSKEGWEIMTVRAIEACDTDMPYAVPSTFIEINGAIYTELLGDGASIGSGETFVDKGFPVTVLDASGKAHKLSSYVGALYKCRR